MKTRIFFSLFVIFVVLCLYGKAQVTSFSENFDATSGNVLPANWWGSSVSGTNYGSGNFYPDHTSGTGRFAWESNGELISPLVAAGTYTISFWMRISSTPLENIQLGYFTPIGNFVLVQTVLNANTTWTQYNYTITLPANEYIAWDCTGTSKTHCIDDVVLTLATGIEQQANPDFNFSFYPIPARDILNVTSVNGKSGKFELNLTDLSGNVIRNYGEYFFEAGVQNARLNLSGISNGIYFLVVKENNNAIKFQKIAIFK